ncbi:imm11 family protein [Taklimakanibacter lacteus]|uniref:imm11 family protein n=1 Tax=Taklimakanibacter lacteus TaxID=2268456 RepID=UPI0013C4320A
MRIYTPAVLAGVEWTTLQDAGPDDWEMLYALSGPVGPGWRTPRMTFIREEEDGTKRLHSDCPWCLHTILVLRDRVVPSLLPLLEAYGELLSVDCEEPVSLFNATTIIAALDEERSAIARFSDGEILAIERHVFKPDVIGNTGIFKLPGRASAIYLSETVVRRFGELGLRNLAFDLLWSDEAVADGDLRIEYLDR